MWHGRDAHKGKSKAHPFSCKCLWSTRSNRGNRYAPAMKIQNTAARRRAGQQHLSCNTNVELSMEFWCENSAGLYIPFPSPRLISYLFHLCKQFANQRSVGIWLRDGPRKQSDVPCSSFVIRGSDCGNNRSLPTFHRFSAGSPHQNNSRRMPIPGKYLL